MICGGLADGEFACYLDACSGANAGTGLINRTGQIAGVHAISTVPDARGLGVASAVVTRILADAAAEGFRTVCLQTGKGDCADVIYKRMGFQERFTLAMYGPTSCP